VGVEPPQSSQRSTFFKELEMAKSKDRRKEKKKPKQPKQPNQ